MLISDNGASPEGGPDGALNVRMATSSTSRETLAADLEAHRPPGRRDDTYQHYPTGWAKAGNTPLKWYKKDIHGGGVRDPLIVHWPAGIAERGGVRAPVPPRHRHRADHARRCSGIEAPADATAASTQMPIHGTSMALHVRATPDAPTRKQTQYFEMLGDRGIWHDGWKAVARHEPAPTSSRTAGSCTTWIEDFSECRDLAAERAGASCAR